MLAMAWLEEQWNKPSRTDYYLMRIAQRMHQQWSKKSVSMEDQRITFTFGQKKGLSMEERVAKSKAAWMGGVKAYKDAIIKQESQRGNRT
jgi:hypothetical protein